VQPAAQAHQRASGPDDVADPVQQPTPAAQRPGACQMADRLFHQGPQPRLQAVERPLLVSDPALGAPVPTGACQCSRSFAMPRQPRSRIVTTPLASST
jgi:hypothetical protein